MSTGAVHPAVILDAAHFSFLRERFVADFPQFALSFSRYHNELARFLALPLVCDGPFAAMSHGVDHLWHTLITHTPQYTEYCNAKYGRYLHHQPRSDRYPVPVEAISNFYVEYPRYFGEVPDTWFEDIPPAHVAAVRMGQVPVEVQQLRWSGWPGWR